MFWRAEKKVELQSLHPSFPPSAAGLKSVLQFSKSLFGGSVGVVWVNANVKRVEINKTFVVLETIFSYCYVYIIFDLSWIDLYLTILNFSTVKSRKDIFF